MQILVGRHGRFQKVILDGRMCVQSKSDIPIPDAPYGFRLDRYGGGYVMAEQHGVFWHSIDFSERRCLLRHQMYSPHQQLLVDDLLYVTHTSRNEIVVFDLKNRTIHQVIDVAEYLPDCSWPNSISNIDGEVLVVFHNHGWSDVGIIEDGGLKLYQSRVGFCCHDIWEMGGSLWTCSSMEGVIRSLRYNESIPLGGFPRGVLLFDGVLFIGISKLRESNSLAAIAPAYLADEGPVADSDSVAVLDRDLSFVGTLDLGPDRFRTVYNIFHCHS